MNISFNYDYDYVAWPSLTTGPFTLTFTSSSNACSAEYEIALCSYCSNSYSHFSVANQPNLHLIPRWRFLDTSFNIVSSLTGINMISSAEGLTGTASFYYVDDMPTIPAPLYLTAEISNTCDTVSCCNVNAEVSASKTRAIIPLWFNEWVPRLIHYTRDGLNEITDKWATLPFNWYATLHDYIPNCGESPIIFSYCNNTKCECTSAVLSTDMEANITAMASGQQYLPTRVCEPTANILAFDKDKNYGWIHGIANTSAISVPSDANALTWLQLSALASISGTMDISYSANNLPQSQYFVYISNPNNSTLTIAKRVPGVKDLELFFSQTDICSQSAFETLSGTAPSFSNLYYPIPQVTSNYTNIMAVTGFAGIYGMAVCRPNNYCPFTNWEEYIWAADAELDCIYKIDSKGNILKTINLLYVDGLSAESTIPTESFVIDKSAKQLSYSISTNITATTSLSTENCAYFNFSISAQPILIEKSISPLSISVNGDYHQWDPIEPFEEFLTFNASESTLNVIVSGSLLSEHDCYILDSLPVSSILIYNISDIHSCNEIGVTPAGIAVDSNFDFWVTLFDSTKVYKFDSEGNHLFTVASGTNVTYDYLENQYKPCVIDTDVDDNVWVAYNNTTASYLCKLSGEDGNLMIQVSDFPLTSTPVDILVDGYDNSVWVSMAFTHYGSGGEIRKYDTSGTLLSTFSGLYMPSNITIDKQRNIWFIYDLNSVGCITLSGDMFNISTLCTAPPWHGNDTVIDEQNLEGIACDLSNILWVIDSRTNQGYTINLDLLYTSLSGFDTFKIIPDMNYNYVNDISGQHIVIDENAKSAQAFCDWTGYRWYQKYSGTMADSTIFGTISGVSNQFKIRPFTQPFELRRFNESWDATKSINSYALAPHMNIKYNLWENFMGNAVGGITPGQQIGRKSYDRIANFPMYHVDISDCNVKQLYSLAQYLDVPIDDYNLSYPPELLRLMDIGSVSHNRLWGEIVKCNLNITENKICPRCGYRHTNLNGKIEDLFNYTVTAGIPFVKHDRSIITPEGWTLEYPPMLGYYGREWTTELSAISAEWTIPALNYDGKYQIIGQYGGYLYSSSDYGSTWTKNNAPSGQWIASAINKTGQYQLAANGSVYISRDYGVTWNIIPGISASWNIAINANGQYQAITDNAGDICISSDYGETWSSIPSSSKQWWGINISDDGKYMLACAQGDYIYSSSDYGSTWTPDYSLSATWYWCSMSGSGQYRLAVTDYSAMSFPGDGKVYISRDYGANWNSVINADLTGKPWWLCGMDKSGRFMMVGSGHEVYSSWDYGISWTKEDLYINDQPHMGMSGDGLYQIIGDAYTFDKIQDNNNFYTLKRILGIIPISDNSETLCGETTEVDTIMLSTYPFHWLSVESGVTSAYNLDLCGPYDYYEYKDDFPRVEDCDPLNANYVQGAGYINWNDDWTTLDWRPNSALDLWAEDGQLYQTAIEYELLRGLQLDSTVCEVSSY